MQTKVKFVHRTRRGVFSIVPHAGRWHILFDGDSLGGYSTPQQAAEDLANGSCTWPSFGDPSGLGIPDDIGDWEVAA